MFGGTHTICHESSKEMSMLIIYVAIGTCF